MKKLIAYSIFFSGIVFAAETPSPKKEGIHMLKEYIALLDKKNTQELLKKIPLTKEQLNECITLADSHLSAQINNQGAEPIVDNLEETQKLYQAMYSGAVGYLLGKLWLSYWPENGLSSMQPEVCCIYVSAACYLSIFYLACYENVKGIFTLLQRFVNRGAFNKASAIKKMLLAQKENQFETESV